MVGIVVVSHSLTLAKAAIELACSTLSHKRVTLLAAAGMDGGSVLGTDATLIAQQIAAADDGSGVLVLSDLGSALIASEMALEFLDPALATRVHVSGAPLVEGLIVATIAAASGKDLLTVSAAAAEVATLKERALSKLKHPPLH